MRDADNKGPTKVGTGKPESGKKARRPEDPSDAAPEGFDRNGADASMAPAAAAKLAALYGLTGDAGASPLDGVPDSQSAADQDGSGSAGGSSEPGDQTPGTPSEAGNGSGL
ncbi:MAG: hypothetical protein AAFX00_10285, partial [Pseudomonadota bacterium]